MYIAPLFHSLTMFTPDDKGYDVHEGKNQSDYEFNNIRESNKQRVIQNGSSFPHKASGFLITFTLLFSLISGFGLWILYAYRNPTTPSGQLLIQWRPSVWRRTMAETRYTAASIHMWTHPSWFHHYTHTPHHWTIYLLTIRQHFDQQHYSRFYFCVKFPPPV